MALRPEDLVLTEKELLLVSKIEEELDQGLKKYFIPGYSFFFSLDYIKVPFEDISNRILFELVSRYLKAGWGRILMEDGYNILLYAEGYEEDNLDHGKFECDRDANHELWNIPPMYPIPDVRRKKVPKSSE